MLDQPNHRQDLELWLFILKVNQQWHGSKGVQDVWFGMRWRGKQLRFDAENANSRDLADAFIYEGIIQTDLTFLKKVCKELLQQRYLTDELFGAVIGGLLRYRPQAAVEMARYLQKKCYRGKDDFIQIFRAACESKASEALHHLEELSRYLLKDNVYHDTVPILWKLQRPDDAFCWHYHLLARNDLPRTFDVLLPFVVHLAYTGRSDAEFVQSLTAVGVNMTGQIRRTYRREAARFRTNPANRDLLELSHQEQGRPVLSDRAIAKALATSAFSFEFVLNSVVFLGTVEIGPLSVRQIVINAPDLATLQSQFKKLEERDIDTGSTSFVNIIHRLRATGHFDLLKLVASSDMHHDEFGNRELQYRLLSKYQAERDLPNLTLTLTILNHGLTNHDARARSINMLFKCAVIRQDWPCLLDIVASTHENGHRIAPNRLTLLVEQLIIGPIKQMTSSAFDRTGFTIGVMQQALGGGSRVSMWHWRMVLIMLGRQRRINELYYLLQFLIHHYNQANVADTGLQHILTPRLQLALIAWDFMASRWQTNLFPAQRYPGERLPIMTPENAPWLRAARFLAAQSADTRPWSKLSVDLGMLQREYVNRLQRLSYVRLNKYAFNNAQTARLRGVSIAEMMRGWMEVWGIANKSLHQGRLRRGVFKIEDRFSRLGTRMRQKRPSLY